jgi:predicted PurR-regulated permease PerM
MADERDRDPPRRRRRDREDGGERAVLDPSPVAPHAEPPVPPEAVVAPREKSAGPLRPEHLYRAVALAFLLAVAFKFFDTLARLFLIVYASAIVAILFSAVRRVIPLERRLLAGLLGVTGIALLGLTLWFGVPALAGQVRGLVEMAPEGAERIQHGVEWLEERTGIAIPITAAPDGRELAEMAGGMGQIFGRAFTALEALLIPIILFFGGLFAMAGPNDRLLNPMLRIVPRGLRPAWYRIFQLLSERLIGWLKGTALAMLAVGILSTIAFTIIGIPNALALGVISGLFEFIPIFGPWIGGGVAALVALVDDPMKAVWAVLAAIVIQQIESYVITPWAMSHSAKLHPYITLFALVVFGGLFGFLGILMALPLALLVWTVVQVLWVERTIDTDADEIAPLVEE